MGMKATEIPHSQSGKFNQRNVRQQLEPCTENKANTKLGTACFFLKDPAFFLSAAGHRMVEGEDGYKTI